MPSLSTNVKKNLQYLKQDIPFVACKVTSRDNTLNNNEYKVTALIRTIIYRIANYQQIVLPLY